MKRYLAPLLIAVLATTAIIPPARAQWTVFDPQNYAQNLLEASRALQQINNQIQSLQNQALMLQNMASNLNPLKEVSQLSGMVTSLNQITSLKEPLPLIESEHDNLTPDKGRACPVRTNEILGLMVHGGTFTPKRSN